YRGGHWTWPKLRGSFHSSGGAAAPQQVGARGGFPPAPPPAKENTKPPPPPPRGTPGGSEKKTKRPQLAPPAIPPRLRARTRCDAFTRLVPSMSAISGTLRAPSRRKQRTRRRSGAARACNFLAQRLGWIGFFITHHVVPCLRAGLARPFTDARLARLRRC